MSFHIWDNQNAGGFLWGRSLPVQLVDGNFNTLLGDNTGATIPSARFNQIADAFSLPETFIEVTIETLPDGSTSASGTATFPRQRIASGAYSFRAKKADNGVPVGTVVAFAGVNVPEGWMLCDGTALDRTEHPELFAAIATAHGAPSESTFNLPDYRGRFLRGVDGPDGPDGTNSDRDPDSTTRTAMASGGSAGNAPGSVQADDFKAHRHLTTRHDNANTVDLDSPDETIARQRYQGQPGLHNANFEYDLGGHTEEPNVGRTSQSGGAETRPANAYVNYIIKY
ncbi:phage tail protein [Roseibacillus persicicus]|uniref:phage tail protein n=1 Tax=Roseibacillus persicicus TaxID=454148 RepID=UPI00366FAEE7